MSSNFAKRFTKSTILVVLLIFLALTMTACGDGCGSTGYSYTENGVTTCAPYANTR